MCVAAATETLDNEKCGIFLIYSSFFPLSFVVEQQQQQQQMLNLFLLPVDRIIFFWFLIF